MWLHLPDFFGCHPPPAGASSERQVLASKNHYRDHRTYPRPVGESVPAFRSDRSPYNRERNTPGWLEEQWT